MNMISTGAFLNEMDASNKQPTAAEKFAAVWEKKNAKAARAGGVSLMALSLAACGSSSTTTTSTDSSSTTTTTPAPAAKTINLTASSVTGTFDQAGDSDATSDTYVGQVAYTDAVAAVASGTYEAGDTVTGGSGTADTLSLTVTGGGASNYTTAALPGALVTGIENLEIRAIHNEAADIVTFDMASAASVTSVNSNLSTSVVSVSNAVSTDTFTMTGNGSVTTGGMTIGYTATQTSGAVNIAGDTAGGTVTVTGTALTAQTINSTGGTNVLTGFTGAATTEDYTINATTGLDLGTGITNVATATGNTVTVSGAAANAATGARAVDLGSSAVDVDIDTIDASGLTAGGIEATLNTSTTVTVTGGKGNDDITTGAVLTTGSVDAGDGDADQLTIGGATHANTAALGAKYTNFEVLENATTSIQNASLISGITSVKSAAAAGGFNNMNAAQLGAITNSVDQTSITYLLADSSGTSDVANITLKNATATSSADLAGAVLTGTETVNITSSSGAKDAGTVASATAAANIVSFASGGADKLTTIDVGGAYGVNLALDNTAKAVTVTNSQTGTADMRIEGEVIKGSSITASANADAIETALAAVAGTTGDFAIYNAGAGNDAISTHLTAINNSSAASASLKIDGGAGTDTVSFAAANVTFTDAHFQYITNVESYTVAATGNTSITTGGFFDANNSGNTNTTITAASIANGSTYTLSGGTFTGKLTNAVTTLSNGVTTADNVSITTGSGNDAVTVTASSFTAATGGANGSITVSTGAGDDTISVTTGTLVAATTNTAVSITGGKGADAITAVHVNGGTTGNFVYNYAAGDSVIGSHDVITGFDLGTNALFADTLNLVGTGVASNTTGTNGTDSGSFKSHAISSGIVTFDDVDTYAAALVVNDTTLASAIAYLDANITTSGDTVAFAFDSNNDGTNESTIVFQQNGTTDTVIELASVLGTSITATNATTAGLIDIA